MAEFKRSRLKKTTEESVSRKAVFLGLLTILLLGTTVIFGLPLLVKLSLFLGNTKDKQAGDGGIRVLPPVAPRLILSYEATNSARIAIKGVAEPGVQVDLLKNDVAIEKTQVTDEGEFLFSLVDLSEGENEFSAIALTEDKGSSEMSKIVKVVFDNQAPSLEMTNPVEKSLSVDYADYNIEGRTEPEASVLVNGKVAMVDDSGNFKIKMQLQLGKNEFEIVARDNAGNETNNKITISYDL
jgi:hypothetical protein